MADANWSDLLAAALTGGVIVKVADIFYAEFRGWWDRSRSAAQFVDDHLDPLLKAADELVGKLRSLSESDFKAVHHVNLSESPLGSSDFGGILFLFASFWARVELFRQEGMSVATSRDRRGKKLNAFIDCLESRRVRVTDRITQRAVGEAMIVGQNSAMSYIAFVDAFEKDGRMQRWLGPIAVVLARTRHTTERQKLLQYGVVLHAMIDALDPKHLVTRERPSYPNKLTKKSWRALRYRVFATYLPFARFEKYLARPKTKKATAGL